MIPGCNNPPFTYHLTPRMNATNMNPIIPTPTRHGGGSHSRLSTLMKRTLVLAPTALCLCIACAPASAGIPLTLTSMNGGPNELLNGTIGPVPLDDPSPNPCAGNPNCYVAGFAVSASWPNKYKGGYSSNDSVKAQTAWNKCFSDPANTTIGHAGRCLFAQGLSSRPFSDRLPIRWGTDTELCVFASGLSGSVGKMDPILSSPGPLGACAKYLGPVGGCSFSSDINIRASGSRASIMSRPHYGESMLSCTSPATGTLRYASTGFSIPLSPSGSCHLDLGSGLGVGHRVFVHSDPVPVRVSCSFDLPVTSTGMHQGSGVIVFTAD